jgi:hypothetical protein
LIERTPTSSLHRLDERVFNGPSGELDRLGAEVAPTGRTGGRPRHMQQQAFAHGREFRQASINRAKQS